MLSLHYQSNKTNLFKEVMVVAVLLLIMLQLGVCLRAASKEVETTMDDYHLALDDSAVRDRVKRESPNEPPKCKPTSMSKPDAKGVMLIILIVISIVCLLAMFFAMCGCLCTETKIVEVDA